MSTTERSPKRSCSSPNCFVGPGNRRRFSAACRGRAVAREGGAVRLGDLGHADAHRAAGEHLRAERLGPAAGQVAELAGHEADDGVRDVVALRVLLEVVRVGVGRGELQREVADDLRRRRHLRDPAEDLVAGGVQVLDRLEPVREAERDRLLPEVRQLAAGDLVLVHAAGGAGQPRFERRVQGADRLPVRLEVADGRQRDARVALGVRERGDEGGEGGLAGRAGHRRGGHVDRVGARVARGEQRRELAAGGVVRVHVHGQVELAAERLHQLRRGARPQQAGHVLDREHVRARLHHLLGEAHVVVERVQGLGGVEQVGGVADGGLRDGGAGGQHRVDGRADLRDVVERVEDAEHVDAGRGGLGDERVGHLRRVRRVADRVAAAQEHLDRDVRDRGAQLREPLPRVLAEEPEGDVVRRTAPRLHGQQLRREPGDRRPDRGQVARADPGREERLVRVAEGRLGDGERGLVAERLRPARRPERVEALLRARRAPAPRGRRRAACPRGGRRGASARSAG